MWSVLMLLFTLPLLAAQNAPQPTPAPNGPYRVEGNRILDREGRSYLIRGTRLPVLTGAASDRNGSGYDFGPLSGTALITIRQRLNMNAVRLTVRANDYEESSTYRARASEIIDLANQLELLVILSAEEADAPGAFWSECAADFRGRPNVFFAPRDSRAVEAIRAPGAAQPIILPASAASADGNVIYEVAPSYADLRSGAARDRVLGGLAGRVPVLVNGLDPRLAEDSAECAAFPRDPAAATELVEASLRYFDARGISWTIASFRPGSLVADERFFIGTKLDDGWTCGHARVTVGLGLVLLGHLWQIEPHGLFAVNGDSGGMLLPRGGIATMYGRILAEQERTAGSGALPLRMDNVSVRITDSRGVARMARLIATGAGWTQISFIVPADAAPGPARIAVLRSDGSRTEGMATIADVAPGITSADWEGRGPAKATAFQRGSSFPTWACDGPTDCRTLPIPLSPGTPTTLRLEGTGFRNGASSAKIDALAGGVRLPALSIRPMPGRPGRDFLTLQVPEDLISRGETDIWVRIDGALSNVVRISFGSAATAHSQAPAARIQLGRYLFYDRRLSVNGTIACATCHRQELAFTDGLPHAVGATGQPLARGTMSLVNTAQNRLFNWSDPATRSLEEETTKALYASDPLEFGFAQIEGRFLRRLRSDTVYRPLFLRAFPNQPDPYNVANMAQAIAAFVRTIVSADAPWDRFHHGDSSAISESAKRGEILFFTDGGPQCFRCHSGTNFGGGPEFHNTALYNPYPAANPGLWLFTRRAADRGKFRAPTLRNIAVTAPYMHDGSIATLEEVLVHYAAGGRAHDNPDKDQFVRGFSMTPQNRADLIAFLESLTDEKLLHDPRFADPWLR